MIAGGHRNWSHPIFARGECKAGDQRIDMGCDDGSQLAVVAPEVQHCCLLAVTAIREMTVARDESDQQTEFLAAVAAELPFPD